MASPKNTSSAGSRGGPAPHKPKKKKKSVVEKRVEGIMTTSLIDNKQLPELWHKRYINKIAAYKSDVAPIVTELLRVCYKAKIPMFIAFALADNGENTLYHNEMLTPITLGIKPLSDDQLCRFVQVLQGYRVTPAADEIELPMEVVESAQTQTVDAETPPTESEQE